jgi:hypothetical protein
MIFRVKLDHRGVVGIERDLVLCGIRQLEKR